MDIAVLAAERSGRVGFEVSKIAFNSDGLLSLIRRFLLWFFQNRETGAITIAQAPNLSLWIVIVAGALLLVGEPTERLAGCGKRFWEGVGTQH